MPLADLARGGNVHSRSGVYHRVGENNYPELPISADTLKLTLILKVVALVRPQDTEGDFAFPGKLW
jgi:hypothetical protein